MGVSYLVEVYDAADFDRVVWQGVGQDRERALDAAFDIKQKLSKRALEAGDPDWLVNFGVRFVTVENLDP